MYIYVYIYRTFGYIHQGVCGIFFPTPMPKPPGGPGKHSISNFGAKIQTYGAKIQIFSAKLKYVAPKLKYVAPNFKYLTQNSNQSNFVPLKSSHFVQVKTPNPASLSPTHPPLGVSKNLKKHTP